MRLALDLLRFVTFCLRVYWRCWCIDACFAALAIALAFATTAAAASTTLASLAARLARFTGLAWFTCFTVARFATAFTATFATVLAIGTIARRAWWPFGRCVLCAGHSLNASGCGDAGVLARWPLSLATITSFAALSALTAFVAVATAASVAAARLPVDGAFATSLVIATAGLLPITR